MQGIWESINKSDVPMPWLAPVIQTTCRGGRQEAKGLSSENERTTGFKDKPADPHIASCIDSMQSRNKWQRVDPSTRCSHMTPDDNAQLCAPCP